MNDIDAPAPSRKKHLPAAIRDGRAFWRGLLECRMQALRDALADNDLDRAEELLRRAKVCEKALRKWDAVEAQAARGEIS